MTSWKSSPTSRSGARGGARRLRTEAEAAFTRLAGMPGMGVQYGPDEPAYAELRYLPVSKFGRYLVFYRSLPDDIEVVRGLHGSRDIAVVLADDFGIQGDEGETDV